MSYSQNTVAQLKVVLRERGLPVSGLKSQLVGRLQTNDAIIKKLERDDHIKRRNEIIAAIENVVAKNTNPWTLPIGFKRYKFRAESLSDVYNLIKNERFVTRLVHFKVMPDDQGLPDVDVEFTSCDEIDTLRGMMANIPSGHIMKQSLNYAEKYTGERYYL